MRYRNNFIIQGACIRQMLFCSIFFYLVSPRGIELVGCNWLIGWDLRIQKLRGSAYRENKGIDLAHFVLKNLPCQSYPNQNISLSQLKSGMKYNGEDGNDFSQVSMYFQKIVLFHQSLQLMWEVHKININLGRIILLTQDHVRHKPMEILINNLNCGIPSAYMRLACNGSSQEILDILIPHKWLLFSVCSRMFLYQHGHTHISKHE